jgi:predicted Zn-dependent protease
MTTERAADMQARQQLVPRVPVPPTLEHAMIAARARVISNPAVDSLRGMVNEAEGTALASQPRAKQAAVLYAGTLAAARLREMVKVAPLQARLDAVVAGDPVAQRTARLLAAEIAQAQQDWPRVLQLVDATSERRPDMLLTTQAWMHTGRAREAAERLQTWVASRPRDAGAWQLLAAAYQAQGQALRGVRAEAEGRVAQLDYPAALDRFRAAQDLVRKGAGGNDYIEASIIDTRARQVESLVREQALER